MKKFAFFLAALLISTSLMAQKADKKKKKHDNTPVAAAVVVAAPVVPMTKSDSVNYAAGMSFTRGLIDYMVKDLKADTAFMAQFVEGYREALAKGNDAAFSMKIIGNQIERQVERQFIPSFIKESQGLSFDINPQMLHEGFIAGVKNDTTFMTTANANAYVDAIVNGEKMARQLTNMKNGRDFLAENAKKEGVVTTESGLQYKVLVQGDGRIPVATDVVKVAYEGKLIDGTVFDSSYDRPEYDYTTFRVNALIKGWIEALTMMPVGSKWELYIPYELAYGDKDTPSIPACSTLIFTLELKEILDRPAPKNTTQKK